MNTRLTNLLQIKYPILQGGMAWVSESRLAAAVSSAGGAGIIGSGGRSVEWVRDEIRTAKTLTDKPFGVNIVMLDRLKDEIVDLVCEEKVAFVTMGAGNPLPYMDKLRQAGIKVLPVVPSVKLAKRVESGGADAVIIEGMECGGHIGTLTTMALLSNVIPEVSIPVIAAGGIVDGRGMAAALLMGADGVQLGSRFLLATECALHANAKQSIISAVDTDSVVTGYSRNHGVRGLRNRFADKFLAMEKSGVPDEELNNFATGTNRTAAIDGDIEDGFVLVGQSLSRLNEIMPADAIIQSLMTETIERLNAAPSLTK
jgi:enoyl-[acyl-carrier protein] reductase II